MKIQIFKILVTLAVTIFLVISMLFSIETSKSDEHQFENESQALPYPEIDTGQRGKLGIDKNINESSVDMYLNRGDSVYYDVRMLIDPANFERIGGDSYLSGFVDGFEVVSYPYLAPVSGLPKSVGEGYKGPTLFKIDDTGKYVPNYEESYYILETLFPKDKYIFLMCGAGGYAGSTKNLLVSLGWDENKIYNVGGYWNYNGQNNINVLTIHDDKYTYDFWKIPYHEIDFELLHEIK